MISFLGAIKSCRRFQNHLKRNFSDVSNVQPRVTNIKNNWYRVGTDVDNLMKVVGSKIKALGFEEEEKELLNLINASDFWTDNKRASEITQRHAFLKSFLDTSREISEDKDVLNDIFHLALDSDEFEVMEDSLSDLVSIKEKVTRLATTALLDGEFDSGNCYIEVSPGAGGVESCDFALMLFNMYQKLSKNFNFGCSVVEVQPDIQAGIKSGVLKITGENAFGWMKSESGVHRLVRCSPFDSNNKRHTSFVQVAILPILTQQNQHNVLLDKKELRIETFKSSGAGGQHVNTTDSAVRITHIPTGIQVSCQSDRSQHSNKSQAMDMLRSKLVQKQIDENMNQNRKLKSEIGSADFGNQIRSYILQPYQLVKDHRTGEETINVKSVLEGEAQIMSVFIQAALLNLTSQDNLNPSTK